MIVLLVINPGTGKPISEKTLRRRFPEELRRGYARANAAVAEALYKAACGDGPGSVRAAIWWLKCRAGWSTRRPAGPTSNWGVLVAPAPVTPEEWLATSKRYNESLAGPPRSG